MPHPGPDGHLPGLQILSLRPQGPEHPAWLFASAELPRVISELDDFEGDAYERRVIPVRVNGRWVRAQIYEGRNVD